MVLSALGSIQAASGSTTQAVETFKHWVRVQPQNAAALLKLAEAQLVAKDYDGAIESLRQALAIQPDLPEAWAAMAAAYFSAGRPESAIAEGRKYQQNNPDRAIGYAIEGDAFVLRKEWPEAAAAFGKALSRQPLPAIAIRRYNALQNAGKQAEATAMADKWFKDHPKEVALRAFVAQQNLRKKDYPAAIRQYEAALEIAPNNALYLNNLAWLLNEVGDPRARKYAEQVYVLTPTNPRCSIRSAGSSFSTAMRREVSICSRLPHMPRQARTTFACILPRHC